MKIRRVLPNVILAAAAIIFLPGCQSAASFPNGLEYLEAKGFGPSSWGMAQVRHDDVLKNINDDRREVLQTLSDLKVVSMRSIKPAYTITLLKGSAFSWEVMTMEVGDDGYGVIRHSMRRTYFYCPKLPAAARAAFDKSTTVLHYTPAK